MIDPDIPLTAQEGYDCYVNGRLSTASGDDDYSVEENQVLHRRRCNVHRGVARRRHERARQEYSIPADVITKEVFTVRKRIEDYWSEKQDYFTVA